MSDSEPLSATGRLEFGFAAEGNLRWAAVDIGALLEALRSRVDLSPIAAAALGRSLAGAELLLRLGSRKLTRLTIDIKGDGPLGRVLAEADRDGNLRGTVGDRRVDLPPTAAGKLAVGEAIGKGFLRVIREQGSEVYQSQVALVTGEIGEDLAHYLEQSEQTRCAVLVGVLAAPGGVVAAGGAVVEVLPGTPDEVIDRLERNVEAMRGVSHELHVRGLDGFLDGLLDGLERTHELRQELRYLCRCDRERLARHLAQLPAEDRTELTLDDGTIEAECLFCGTVYRFAGADLDAAAGE